MLQGSNPIMPGIPPGPFIVLGGLASLFTCLTCLALSVLLFRLKRTEPMALFVSFYLMGYGIILAGPLELLEGAVPGASGFAIQFIQPIFFGIPTVALLVLFPDGRAVPRWTRWLVPLAVIGFVLLPWVQSRSSEYALWIVMAATLTAGIYGQGYRYRRVSTRGERLQTKWVLAGFVAWFLLLMVQSLPYAYLTSFPPGSPLPAWAGASSALWWFSLSIVPGCLTIAILRYRLYEIDIIINRALVYGGLTAILAGLYAASISLFQRTFVALTGNKSDAAIVLTTLILASVFTPLRTRLQAAVDRRFKDIHDSARRLGALTDEINQAIWVLHPQQAAHRLLTESVEAFGARGGAVYWGAGRMERQTEEIGRGATPEAISSEIMDGGRVLGRIALGPRNDELTYTSEDRRALDQAAQAIALGFLRAPMPPANRPKASVRPSTSSTRRTRPPRKSPRG
jgi:hypothetical protein